MGLEAAFSEETNAYLYAKISRWSLHKIIVELFQGDIRVQLDMVRIAIDKDVQTGKCDILSTTLMA